MRGKWCQRLTRLRMQCVYAAEWTCSMGVLGFQTFKLAFCIYNRLHSHTEILGRLRSNRSVLDLSNSRPWNPKLTLKVNGPWLKVKDQNFVVTCLRKKEGIFLLHGLFRISASKGAFKYMVHVDAQCNLSSFCTRQRQDRTTSQRNRLNAKEDKNLRCGMSFFFCRVSANESCLISCDFVLVSS